MSGAGGASDEVGGFDGYSCPFCPTTVTAAAQQSPRLALGLATQEQARMVMESHLDGHFSIGLPLVGAA